MCSLTHIDLAYNSVVMTWQRDANFLPLFLMSSYFTKWGINHTLLSNFFGFYYFINAQVSRSLIFFPRLVRLYLLIQDLLYYPFLTWSGVLHAWLCVSWIKDHKNNLLDALIDIIEIDFLNGKTILSFFALLPRL